MLRMLLIFFLLSISSFSNELLTKEEKNWIKDNPNIKIAMINNFQPFSYIENGKHKGFSVDLLNKISKISGLNFEVKNARWSKTLNSFKDQEVDMISDISYTKERESFSLFTNPYYEIPIYIFGLKNDKNYIDNSSLKGKRVGVTKNIFYKDELIKLGIKIVELVSSEDKAKALVTGHIDYFLSSYTTGIKAIKTQSLVDVKAIDEFNDIKKEDLRFAVNKNKPILKSILNKSLKKIENKYFFYLSNKWILGNENIDNISKLFSIEEQNFINNTKNKPIKIGSIDTYIPFSFSYNGEKIGFTQELIEIIAKKSGLNFEKVGGTWPQVYGKFKNKEIDIISELSYRDERLPFTLYTKPYYEIPIGVFAKEDFGTYSGFKSLKGKKVGIVKGSYLIGALKDEKDFDIVQFDTNNEKFYGLRDGIVDVVLSRTMSIYRLEELMIKGIKTVGIFSNDKIKNEDLRFGIRIEQKTLASIMSKTLSSIPFSKISQLKQKWILENYGKQDIDSKNTLVFTQEEKEFIIKHPEITYSEVNWKPLSIIENNRMNGIMGDYLKLVSKKTGIKFNYIPASSWPEVLNMFKDKKIDLVPGIGTSPQEVKLGLVSKTYSKYPMAIVTGENIKYIQNLNELDSKTIAVPKYYTSYNYLVQKHPNIKILETSNIPEALLKVEAKEADAFIGHIATSLYYLSDFHLKNLKISGVADFNFEHKYLIQNDYPLLLSIINKTFDAITQEEKKTIHSKWIQPQIIKENTNYELIYRIIGGFTLILIVVLYFLSMLKKQKKEFETIFETSKDGIAIIDLKTNFLKYNDAYLKMLNYSDDELKTKSLDKLVILEQKELLRNMLKNVLLDGYVKNLETVYIDKDDNRVNVNMTASLLPDKKRVLIVTKDVTSLKLLENHMKLASMGEMIGNIAHQWRQPLSVITSSASGLRIKSEYDDKISLDDVKSFSDTILNQANYLSETIDDFKNFIKGTNEFKQIDILSVVKKSLSLTRPSISDNFIKIVKDTEDNLSINGNKSELEQVLINIMNNAKDALIQNVNEGDRLIFISTKKINENSLELKICDNAGGISKDIIQRIFEPYFTTKHKSIGTGLGLSIVDKIIRQRHEQIINVYNESFKHEGKDYMGACFSIIFTKK